MNKYWVFLAAMTAALARAVSVPKTVVPLGDSITDGNGSEVVLSGYRRDLYRILIAQCVPIQYQGVINATKEGTAFDFTLLYLRQNYCDGFSGYASGDILANLDAKTAPTVSTFSNYGGYWFSGGGDSGRPPCSPDIVTLLMGTNDFQYGVPLPVIESNFIAVLDWFHTHRPKTEVIVSTPPPRLKFNDVPNIKAIQAVVQEAVTTRFPEDRSISVYQDFLLPDGSVNPEKLSADGLHPSDAGYVDIANEFDRGMTVVPNQASTLAGFLCVSLMTIIRPLRRESAP